MLRPSRELVPASPRQSLLPLQSIPVRLAQGVPHLPRMTPLGAAGGCQTSRTKVVLTSGKRSPTGGPGTAGGEIGVTEEWGKEADPIPWEWEPWVCWLGGEGSPQRTGVGWD